MGAAGSVLLDFGPFPGASDAAVTVTGLTGILATSRVEAWLEPDTTVDHTADEHMLETLKVFADKSSIVPDTSVVIKGFNTSQLNEPVLPDPYNGQMIQAGATSVAWLPATSPGGTDHGGGRGTRIYGKWNIGYAWF